tara:strand:- start:854 stop:967 length:114 start_codon:yes stop_codon:yes gene_type:complete
VNKNDNPITLDDLEKPINTGYDKEDIKEEEEGEDDND